MAGIDKNRWTILSPLLDELLDADEAVRSVRLAHIRDTDGDLADDLSALLHRQAIVEKERFLEGSATPLPVESVLAGREIGNYRLERQLGRGGMGAVWLAHRSDGRYAGQAAVKFLNLSLLGPAGIDRFRSEGNALARLAHPHIARLLDAGVTVEGQPYLVLEYVEGQSIDRWCEAGSLGVRARVRLFLQVLDAVAHAHSKLILHRDLKPPNILVTGAGQVKLLDFGIARLIDEEQARAPTATGLNLGARAFTPEYAAPEQVQGAEVTTATDVYALGVLLSALVGEAPHGDLDLIIAKAQKRDPSNRYRTVAAFADDLQRYLGKEPISARPDSVSYRLGRFVARNRTAVAAASVVLLAIVTASGFAAWHARQATVQRDQARALSARNNAVMEFVSSMLTEVVPADQPIPMGDLLERSESVLLGIETRPQVKASILNILATYYLNAGDVAKAQPLLTRSLELTRDSADLELRAELLCSNALAASLLGDPQQAQAQMREARALSNDDVPAPARCIDIAAKLAGR